VRAPPHGRLRDRDEFIRGGYLNDVTGFDSKFFKFSPNEAQELDPQQFHLLEAMWECFEDANVIPSSLHGTETGMFIGSGFGEHLAATVGASDLFTRYTPTTIIPCMIANRLSYTYGLNGPSLTIDTACAGSLNAMNDAVFHLQTGKVDLCFAGGSNFLTEQNFSTAIMVAHLNSPTGETKPFDASADGYVRAEGCGIVLLKRYDEAVRDGDHIHGVILGCETNHNGATGLSFTTPSAPAQKQLIHKVLERTTTKAEDVCYVEAHGTSTAVGDPIEANALNEVFMTPQRTKRFTIFF
jgi:acyl transferase domain-containing protein